MALFAQPATAEAGASTALRAKPVRCEPQQLCARILPPQHDLVSRVQGNDVKRCFPRSIPIVSISVDRLLCSPLITPKGYRGGLNQLITKLGGWVGWNFQFSGYSTRTSGFSPGRSPDIWRQAFACHSHPRLRREHRRAPWAESGKSPPTWQAGRYTFKDSASF
jgi:hypothetical protein